MRHDVGLMGGTGSRIATGLAVLAAALGFTVTSASAAPAMILPDPTCCTFESGPFIQDMGDISIIDNSGTTAPHDVRSTQRGPDGRFLFESVVALGGGSNPVTGTQYLTTGTYPFYCTIHGPSMSGELEVSASGKAVPRPSVKVSFVNQRLKQVRKRGVKVKLRATTASKGVTVTAKKGKVLLGSKGKLSFSAGQTRTITLPLTGKGRKAIRKGKVVKISLRATVNYGKPSNATRKVR